LRAPIGYLAISDIPVSVYQGIIAVLLRLYNTDGCYPTWSATCKDYLQVHQEGNQQLLSGPPTSPRSLMGTPTGKLENSVFFSVQGYLDALARQIGKGFLKSLYTEVVNLATFRAFNRK